MDKSHKQLWKHIEEFQLDDGISPLSFRGRLARENGWSIPFADQVILEYKRFVFLTQVSETPVTPSFQVDQVWHLHLTYTQSYWQGLCPLLKWPLHHGPTKGGRQESKKYLEQYEYTKRIYEREFGTKAPQEFWPPSEVRFGRDVHFQWINRKDHWIIPKPTWLWKNRSIFTLALPLILF